MNVTTQHKRGRVPAVEMKGEKEENTWTMTTTTTTTETTTKKEAAHTTTRAAIQDLEEDQGEGEDDLGVKRQESRGRDEQEHIEANGGEEATRISPSSSIRESFSGCEDEKRSVIVATAAREGSSPPVQRTPPPSATSKNAEQHPLEDTLEGTSKDEPQEQEALTSPLHIEEVEEEGRRDEEQTLSGSRHGEIPQKPLPRLRQAEQKEKDGDAEVVEDCQDDFDDAQHGEMSESRPTTTEELVDVSTSLPSLCQEEGPTNTQKEQPSRGGVGCPSSTRSCYEDPRVDLTSSPGEKGSNEPTEEESKLAPGTSALAGAESLTVGGSEVAEINHHESISRTSRDGLGPAAAVVGMLEGGPSDKDDESQETAIEAPVMDIIEHGSTVGTHQTTENSGVKEVIDEQDTAVGEEIQKASSPSHDEDTHAGKVETTPSLAMDGEHVSASAACSEEGGRVKTDSTLEKSDIQVQWPPVFLSGEGFPVDGTTTSPEEYQQRGPHAPVRALQGHGAVTYMASSLPQKSEGEKTMTTSAVPVVFSPSEPPTKKHPSSETNGARGREELHAVVIPPSEPPVMRSSDTKKEKWTSVQVPPCEPPVGPSHLQYEEKSQDDNKKDPTAASSSTPGYGQDPQERIDLQRLSTGQSDMSEPGAYPMYPGMPSTGPRTLSTFRMTSLSRFESHGNPDDSSLPAAGALIEENSSRENLAPEEAITATPVEDSPVVKAEPLRHYKAHRDWRVWVGGCVMIVILVITAVFSSRRADEPPEPPIPRSPRFTEIQQRVVSQSVSAEAAFNDPNSSQVLATNWLADVDTHNTTSELLVQRYILAVFYFSTDGPNWKRNRTFLSDRHECLWTEDDKGVEGCDLQGHVTKIHMPDNNMGNLLPSEISKLPHLRYLYLSDNDLAQGNIPDFLFEMTNLTHLEMKDNNLVGSMSTKIGLLTKLTTLSFRENGFFGDIPLELGNMTNLMDLNLNLNYFTSIPPTIKFLSKLTALTIEENKLNGPIPEEVGELGNLMDLRLSENDLSGELPPSLNGLTKLKRLDLYINFLSGQIPSSMWDLTTLTKLSLRSNRFSGTIDSGVGKLTKLVDFRLRSNNLTSSIPSTIGQLAQLVYLQIYNNSLTGEIPTTIGNLTKLKHLDLFENKLSGTLPESLWQLTTLTKLSMRENRLSGVIDSRIGQLLDLKDLRLADNSFVGPFPTSMFGLEALQLLNVSYNNWTSTIPTDIGQLTQLEELLLSNCSFHGTMPSELGSLSELEELFLSHNMITGTIPLDFSNLERLAKLHLQGNQLNGSVNFICETSLGMEEFLVDCDEVQCDCCCGSRPGFLQRRLRV